MFYPAVNADGTLFGVGLTPQVLPTPFVPGAAPSLTAQSAPHDVQNETQANMVAHESNGMVYYYDPANLPGGTQAAPVSQFQIPPAGGMLGMGGMMTPPTQYYYPPTTGMFYAQQ